MKLPTAKIEGVVQQDASRQSLAGVYVDQSGAWLVASDGKCLAAVPVDPEDVRGSGLEGKILPVESLKAARRQTKQPEIHMAEGHCTSSGKLGTVAHPPIDATFPDWHAIVAPITEEEADLVVALNADILLRLARALQGQNEAPVVKLYLRKSKRGRVVEKAIGVAVYHPEAAGGLEAYGVIMPCAPPPDPTIAITPHVTTESV